MFVPLLSISWTHINQSEIVFMGQIQSQSKNIFVGQIQPWSDIVCIYWSHTTEVWNYIYRSNTTLVFVTRPKIDTKNKPFSVRPIFLILKLDLFFNTKDFGHKGLPLKRNSSKMRGKKALGLICGWPSLGGWKEMTSDMAQVTKQGSEVNIKYAFSPQNVKYLHPFLYTVQFYFSSWKSRNKETLTIKKYFCWSFSNYIFEF